MIFAIIFGSAAVRFGCTSVKWRIRTYVSISIKSTHYNKHYNIIKRIVFTNMLKYKFFINVCINLEE